MSKINLRRGSNEPPLTKEPTTTIEQDLGKVVKAYINVMAAASAMMQSVADNKFMYAPPLGELTKIITDGELSEEDMIKIWANADARNAFLKKHNKTWAKGGLVGSGNIKEVS